MAGPWEKYQMQGAAKPWERFQPPSEPYSESYYAQGTSGLNEGLANMLGAPVDLVNAALGLGMKGVNAVAGTDFQPSERPFLGADQIKDWMGGAIQPPSDDPSKQFLRRTAQSVGSATIPMLGTAGKVAAPVKYAAQTLFPAATGGAAAATANQVFPGSVLAEAAAELAGGFGSAGILSKARQGAADKAARGGVLTRPQIKENARAQYREAETNGVTATRLQTHKLYGDMRKIAEAEGLVSPTGRISEAYPKAREALRMLEDYSKGTMTVPQMQAVRKTLGDAAKSADGSEGRIASMMLERFDSFTSPLAPQLEKGNALWHTASKAKKLEQLKELAGSRAGQFTGSGFENALRTEYRGLERRIIKEQEKGWTDAEKKAITKVAQGTPGSNAARAVGRFAPTGPVSYAATAGLPFMAGNAVGGPMMGILSSLGAGAAAFGGRGIATRQGLLAADEAETLVRNMGVAPKGILDPETIRGIIGTLLATNAASQANR